MTTEQVKKLGMMSALIDAIRQRKQERLDKSKQARKLLEEERDLSAELEKVYLSLKEDGLNTYAITQNLDEKYKYYIIYLHRKELKNGKKS